jgi:hypothetical protein
MQTALDIIDLFEAFMVPQNHKILYKNPVFKIGHDEILLLHTSPKKNLKSIIKSGLLAGTGKPGGYGSAGSMDLWAWRNPQEVIDAIKSGNEIVVIFAAKDAIVTSLSDTKASFIKKGVISADKISLITLPK